MTAEARRPRLLVLNQYYWPGVEATAHLLTQLCEALAEDFDVTVVTGRVDGDEGRPGRVERNGVTVVRVNSTAFERAQLAKRAANYLTYLAQSARVAAAEPRPDVVLCMTDPPIIGALGEVIGRRFGAPLVVISQDVFPEIAVELRRLENPLVVGALRVVIAWYLRNAEQVVAIGETMRARLAVKGARDDRIAVIPNWVDTKQLVPSPRDNPWSREHGLADRFVVMHSGNVGHAQDLDSLVRAGTMLRDLDDLTIAVIGAGARADAVNELARLLEVDAMRFMPYQPRELLTQSLSTASVHVVGLARGLAGYVVPSRFYGILAVGRPVIVAAEPTSETAQIVERTGCGLVVPPGRPELLAEAIRAMHDGEHDLEAMGARGREYVVREADRSVAIARYRTLLRGVVAG